MYIHVADNLVCNLLFWLTKCQPCWSASLLQDSTLYLHSFKEIWPGSLRQDAISFVTPGSRGFH